MAAFASTRARRQVERLVDYAAFPGLGLVVEPDGRVLIERGEAPSSDTAPDGHYVMSVELRAGFRLCVFMPNEISAAGVHPRLRRARDRLVKMMARGRSGGDGAGSEANALWIFASLPNDPLE